MVVISAFLENMLSGPNVKHRKYTELTVGNIGPSFKLLNGDKVVHVRFAFSI